MQTQKRRGRNVLRFSRNVMLSISELSSGFVPTLWVGCMGLVSGAIHLVTVLALSAPQQSKERNARSPQRSQLSLSAKRPASHSLDPYRARRMGRLRFPLQPLVSLQLPGQGNPHRDLFQMQVPSWCLETRQVLRSCPRTLRNTIFFLLVPTLLVFNKIEVG